MNAMKNIQEVVHSKELEILKAVEESVRQQEVQLRQLQKGLLEALQVVNRLLETDNAAVEAALAEANSAVRSVRTPSPSSAFSGKYEGYPGAPTMKMSGNQVP